jgi:hypothetical protein
MQNVVDLAATILKTTDIDTLESYVKWLKDGQKFANILSETDSKPVLKDVTSKEVVRVASKIKNLKTPKHIITNSKSHSGFVRYSECISYDEAKDFIISQGIKTVTEFQAWVRAGKRPVNFPGSPDRAYVKEWTSWTNFLDPNHKVTNQLSKMSYHQAKQLLKAEGITGFVELMQWIKAKKRPNAFPSEPKNYYTKHGVWKGWDDLFSVSRASNVK